MAYNTKSTDLNKHILINTLNLKQDRNTVFFENDEMIVLSPAIQNDSWWFDLLRGNVEKVRESPKDGLLVLRFFDKLLVTPLKKFIKDMVDEKFVVKRQQGKDNWKFNIREMNDNFVVVNQKNSSLKYPVKSVTVEELIMEVASKTWLNPDINPISEGKETDIVSNIKPPTLINEINKYFRNKGFIYSKDHLKNFYMALKSKPFVIFSGISGTGKTKIIELFAEAVGANYENGRFKLIPVRPDWSDSSDLLGYKDLKNDFIQGPLTEMIIKAKEAPDSPHFVVLDEMNLARVEYYLSDFLSVIESRKFNGHAIETAPIVEFDGESYGIPDNLYIIGTVNMDETTHPFSKKVLDRANTIEFNEVDLLNFSIFEQQGEEVAPIKVTNDIFKSKYIQLKDVYNEHTELVVSVSEELVSINKKLEKIYAQVGYRVRDEIAFYMAYNEEYQLMDQNQAMDYCIMQKILPRISGTGAEIEEVLKELFELFVNVNEATSISIDSSEELNSIARYPLSANKLREMNKRYRSLGFVSFWIS